MGSVSPEVVTFNLRHNVFITFYGDVLLQIKWQENINDEHRTISTTNIS